MVCCFELIFLKYIVQKEVIMEKWFYIKIYVDISFPWFTNLAKNEVINELVTYDALEFRQLIKISEKYIGKYPPRVLNDIDIEVEWKLFKKRVLDE